MTGLSQGIEKRVIDLQHSRDAHTEILQKLMGADEGRIFGVDLIAWAVLNRSLSLIEGFTMMIEARNLLCAGALLRLQVDSAMRLYACWLVDEPHNLVKPLLRGEPLKRTKSKTGESLTDHYLTTELSKLYPWVDSVYKATSGFVHLSQPHMISPVNCVEGDGSVLFGLGSSAREARDEEFVEALEGFIETTKCLIHLVASWLFTKEKAGKERTVGHP